MRTQITPVLGKRVSRWFAWYPVLAWDKKTKSWVRIFLEYVWRRHNYNEGGEWYGYHLEPPNSEGRDDP